MKFHRSKHEVLHLGKNKLVLCTSANWRLTVQQIYKKVPGSPCGHQIKPVQLCALAVMKGKYNLGYISNNSVIYQ